MLTKTKIPFAFLQSQSKTRFGLFLVALVFLGIAFINPRMNGDGSEYLMMAHGFYKHASPEIKPADFRGIVENPEMAPAKTGLPIELLSQVPQRLDQNNTLFGGFARGERWGIQAIHFWMYSLLAAPFCALVFSLGLHPALTFVLLNLSITAITARTLLRWHPKLGVAGILLFLLLGPVLYVGWTGPEVFSACCALLACSAMIRRDIALSAALAGFGATQNPSIAGLILGAWAYWGLLSLRPTWALFPSAGQPHGTTTRNVLLTLGGIGMAALPYIYNEIVFGMPSIIAANFTASHLIGYRRFFSFFFDVNQGIIVGLPGLFLAVLLLFLFVGRTSRFRWFAYCIWSLCLIFGLALPSLATVNWNNGYIVVLRYAYWAAMPLVALCIVGLSQLSSVRRRTVVGGVAALQLLAMLQAHWPHNTSYLEHGALAAWVLDHAPRFYDPDPEVFYERELHKEEDLFKSRVIIHSGPGGPSKLMRSWTNTADSGGICPPGQVIASPGVSAGQGWTYYNRPFKCGAPSPENLDWVFGSAGNQRPTLLAGGWSGMEATGVWSDGGRSVLTIPLPKNSKVRRLGIDGMYFRPQTTTDVTVNGVHIGRVRLGTTPIAIPESAMRETSLTVVLVHEHPVSPASLGMSTDQRPLAFFLQRIHLDGGSQ